MLKVKLIEYTRNAATHDKMMTVEATYPRIIHEEVLTHRSHALEPQADEELSRNSASSRAIPTPKWLSAVASEPFVPKPWLSGLPRMANGEPLDPNAADEATETWLWIRDVCVLGAKRLNELGVLKHHANRPLYAFQHITTVMSATTDGWDNFFGLRFSEFAAPEFTELAAAIYELWTYNTPRARQVGDWHLPYITEEERSHAIHKQDVWELVMRSATRCGRVSYLRQGELGDYDTEVERAQSFVEGRHWSTCEHPARLSAQSRRYGNLRGFKSMRKHYRGENIAPLVIPRSYQGPVIVR
jgi:hypothetical protein